MSLDKSPKDILNEEDYDHLTENSVQIEIKIINIEFEYEKC